jgi:hypothetical protein
MAISLPDARELSDEVPEALRLRALRGCQLGFTETEIADLLGVCRETVCHWWSAYADGGLDALPHDRTGRALGSGHTLSDEQAARIQQQLCTHQPEELGIAAPFGDTPRRRRTDSPAVGHRPGRANRGPVSATLGLHAQATASPRSRSRSPRSTSVAGGDLSSHRTTGWPGKRRHLLGRRGRRGSGRTAGLWLCAGGRTGPAMDVPDPYIHANPMSAISNMGKIHFMTYLGTMNAALFWYFWTGCCGVRRARYS